MTVVHVLMRLCPGVKYHLMQGKTELPCGHLKCLVATWHVVDEHHHPPHSKAGQGNCRCISGVSTTCG